jgi:hypothetical protein
MSTKSSTEPNFGYGSRNGERLIPIMGTSDYEIFCVIHNVEPIVVCLDNFARSFSNRNCQPPECFH